MNIIGSNGYFVFLIIFHLLIGIFAIYRMKIRTTKDNPDSQFTPLPQTITPLGMELNPSTEPIDEPEKTLEDNNKSLNSIAFRLYFVEFFFIYQKFC